MIDSQGFLDFQGLIWVLGEEFSLTLLYRENVIAVYAIIIGSGTLLQILLDVLNGPMIVGGVIARMRVVFLLHLHWLLLLLLEEASEDEVSLLQLSQQLLLSPESSHHRC